MKVRIGIRFNKELSAVLASQFLLWSYFALEISGRSEDDFLNAKESCGQVEDFYYQDTRRGRQWWLIIKSTGKEKFDVGRRYIIPVLKAKKSLKGSFACISYIRIDIFTSTLITQIVVNDKKALNKSAILSVYLVPVTKLRKTILVILFVCSLLSLVRIKKK